MGGPSDLRVPAPCQGPWPAPSTRTQGSVSPTCSIRVSLAPSLPEVEMLRVQDALPLPPPAPGLSRRLVGRAGLPLFRGMWSEDVTGCWSWGVWARPTSHVPGLITPPSWWRRERHLDLQGGNRDTSGKLTPSLTVGGGPHRASAIPK